MIVTKRVDDLIYGQLQIYGALPIVVTREDVERELAATKGLTALLPPLLKIKRNDSCVEAIECRGRLGERIKANIG